MIYPHSHCRRWAEADRDAIRGHGHGVRLDLRNLSGPRPRVQDQPRSIPREAPRMPGLDAIRRGPLEGPISLSKASLPTWLQGIRRTMTLGAATAVLGASLMFGSGAPVADLATSASVAPPQGALTQPAAVELVDTITAADPRIALEAVRSLAVEQAEEAVEAAHRQLGKAHQRRHDAIEGMLANMQTNGASAEAIARLQEDLHRPIEDVATTKDSRRLHPGLQSDVAKWFRIAERRSGELHAALEAFARLDEAYLAPTVGEVLAPLDLRPADLKALVAQESGDHLLQDSEGDIAGIAQIGTREVREVAPHLDRKDDVQAIELAARVLVKKAEQLEAMAEARGVDFDAVREGPDYHRFLFAAYNAGAAPIAKALRIAKDAGLDYTSWAAVLGDEGQPSSLHAGLRATPAYGRKAGSKLDEVTTYVERIDARRPALDVLS